jgi:hypothetical protein
LDKAFIVLDGKLRINFRGGVLNTGHESSERTAENTVWI